LDDGWLQEFDGSICQFFDLDAKVVLRLPSSVMLNALNIWSASVMQWVADDFDGFDDLAFGGSNQNAVISVDE
jgi:hypothetical protein